MGKARLRDTVRRRRWVKLDACTDLRSEITGLPLQVATPSQISASREDEAKRKEASLTAMVSLLHKAYGKISVLDSVATLSPLCWTLVAADHQEAYHAIIGTLSQPEVHAGPDAERMRGVLYALPYAKAAYGDAML